MFTAENRKSPTPVDFTNNPTTSLGGFGRVLSSVQGLQQRLNDFSFDEVSEIETNANSLIQGLSRLQIKLAWLATLKHALLNAQELIDDTPEFDYDLIGPDSLAKHPGLHAIVNADKLIRLHRALQIAKESAESITLTPRKPIPPRPNNLVTKTRAENDETEPQLPTDREFLSAALSDQLIAEPTDDHTESLDATQSNFSNDRGTDTELSAGVSSDRPTTALATARGHESPSDRGKLRNQEVQDPMLAPPGSQGRAEEAATENPVPVEPPTHPARGMTPTVDGGIESRKPKTPDPSHFDQRLLDELIQNYGEFVISPESTPRPDESFRPEPNFVAPTPASMEEKVVTVPEPQRASGVAKHGDLDSQLKKIIKDYGEKDLYTDRKSVKFKKTGIIAFILLALLACGFYFLRTPAITPKPFDGSGPRSGAAADSADGAKIVEGNQSSSPQR